MPTPHHVISFRCQITLLLSAIFLAACSTVRVVTTAPTDQPTAVPTATTAPTLPLSPTDTPTPAPLGSSENPIVIGFVASTPDQQSASQAAALASKVAEQTKLSVQSLVSTNYSDLLVALSSGKVQFAWLPPMTYLLARQDGSAEAILVANHYGLYSYGTQFLANISSGYTQYYDPDTAKTTADAAHALRQFAGKRPCWAGITSPSGYLLPQALFKTESIQVQSGIDLLDATTVVRALYIQGICDFGTVFGVSGDPRTSTVVITDLPDALQKVTIIWQSDAVIPNLAMVVNPEMQKSTRLQVANALQSISQTEDGQKLLSDATQYQMADLKTIDDSFYDPLRQLIQSTELDLSKWVGK
jgi:phosphonate transport system substrate-binding protein